MSSTDAAKNYYAILGSREDATQDEIERLYKRLAIRYHPDRGGNAERMKVINEAYRVLGNEATRRAYDLRRKRGSEGLTGVSAPLSPLSAALPDTAIGRLIGALLVLLGGLLFLFLLRIYYIRFMWPIFLFAVFVVLLGVWKVHGAMIFARQRLGPSHVIRRYAWVQEVTFWLMACIGAYFIYLLMSAM